MALHTVGCRQAYGEVCTCRFPPAVDTAINGTRKVLEDLTSDERVELFDAIAEGYCTACGNARKGICYCENDE